MLHAGDAQADVAAGRSGGGIGRIEAAPSPGYPYEPLPGGWADVSIPGVEAMHWPIDGTGPYWLTWNPTHHGLLSAPLLRADGNTLPGHGSGIGLWHPEFRQIIPDEPDRLDAPYERLRLLQHDLRLVCLAITATLGCFFFSLWLLRRDEAAYGWFGATSFAWLCYGLNLIATSPFSFPSPDTDSSERFVSIAFAAFCASFAMFVLRYCGQRYRRTEVFLWVSIAAGTLAIVIVPRPTIDRVRDGVMTLATGLVITSCVAFVILAWHNGGRDQRILAACAALLIAAGVHDMLAFAGYVGDTASWWTVSSPFVVTCMAVLMMWRFVIRLQRIEGYGLDLHCQIEAARKELATTLQREHEAELANARLGERISLAHDLHDGLGGTLVSSIATLEHTPELIPAERFISILKELRDDLRIIIDTASSRQFGEHSLAELLVPLRHRLTRLFENSQIECHWHICTVDQVFLSASQNLDVMRILQEALTNVLKHSGASRVDVSLGSEDGDIRLSVVDNGCGFDVAAVEAAPGAGMRSMKNRIQRLGGTLSVNSSPWLTTLYFHIPASCTGEARDAQRDLCP